MQTIPIDKLLRSRRRTIGLEVTHDAALLVRAPLHASLEEIRRVLRREADWILEKKALARRHMLRHPPKKFASGEIFYYLGRPYSFSVTDADEITVTGSLEFPRHLASDVRGHLKNWYRARALETLEERARVYAGEIGCSYRRLRISNARKRLGSCSLRGNVNFSWRIIMAPLHVIDYIVVHELVHLKEHNHSARFWDRVRAAFPRHEESRRWLRENGHLLTID
ncbi:MAG: M48 family metallopeptidase [Candidatus Omnitrophica bacterium]|nr:M48 family metallopeptidase [Candidatus Omnitrophota bacterium]